ncbi:MAG: alpha/beta hydrolase [Myxococcales bacterium]|nr:alpha/beta hydrolase [Myxococcales bacterium]
MAGTLTLRANGLRFAAHVVGEGPLLLLLHGFPDDADSLLPLAHALPGYRVVVPFLRGYGPSEVPRRRVATLRTLAADLTGWLDALGAEDAAVVGHDWGAAIGYAAAVFAPTRVRRLVALSVPPPAVLLPALRHHPRQLARSSYMLAFQLPGAEAAVRARDFAAIDALWRRWSPGFEPPPGRVAAVKRSLAGPGALATALGYYRGLLRSKDMLTLAQSPLPCPTLVLGGSRDGCMGPEVFTAVRPPGAAPYTVEILKDVGHFLPLEATDAVARRVLAFLAAP